MSIKHAQFQAATSLAGAALTGTYQDLLVMEGDQDIIFIFNSCDQTIVLSFDGGITDQFILPATYSFSFDARTNKKRIAKNTIKAKHAGVVPTTGLVSATVGK